LKLLLDTHVLLWWLTGNKPLSKEATRVIKNGSNLVFISAVTAWEISIKKVLGKLRAPDDFEAQLMENNFQSLPITIPHATLAGQLPIHHDDPFDRLLIAQSKIEGLTLVTRDQKQMLYDIQIIEA
jgi:PIN domain nuclease of toxin-antitoxin system